MVRQSPPICELIDLGELQTIQDDYAHAAGISSVLVSPEGALLTAFSNPTVFCRLIQSTEKGRQHCLESFREMGQKGLASNEAGIHYCFAQGGHYVAPIVIEGEHYATMYAGQFIPQRFSPEQLRSLERTAPDIDVSPETLVEAAKGMRVIGEDAVRQRSRLLFGITRVITKLGVHAARLKQAQASLQEAHDRLEGRVSERTLDLMQANQQLQQEVTERKQAEEEREALNKRFLEISRQVGMAEVATGVLHNVGNVLNSVNVSASIVADKVRQSEVPSLAKAAQLLDEHADELATFLSEDERGKHLPRLLGALAESLTSEQAVVLKELQSLIDSVEHIKTIVGTQQSYAVTSSLAESVSLASLVEDALKMNAFSLQHRSIRVERDYAELPLIEVEKQKLLQILTNLIRNAGHALADKSGRDRRLMIQIAVSGDDRVRIEVADNGVGIPLENMTRIFAHGFTTRKARGGHGFGLHYGALLAEEMGGSLTAHSDGRGKGATFTVELPLKPAGVTRGAAEPQTLGVES